MCDGESSSGFYLLRDRVFRSWSTMSMQQNKGYYISTTVREYIQQREHAYITYMVAFPIDVYINSHLNIISWTFTRRRLYYLYIQQAVNLVAIIFESH